MILCMAARTLPEHCCSSKCVTYLPHIRGPPGGLLYTALLPTWSEYGDIMIANTNRPQVSGVGPVTIGRV